ncbi:hypothetical protein [Pseudomonas panipatensis]|uniref:Flagellar basal body rod FlgEFG protein C-terminal n=1 Tax=Pseudomonas panipatensis TaxID=428992 RepID=A0A1G8JC23_9PSED|nr:hypothetical protein [Pseudomonas panipatensis]SDI28785.1 hypothetical protein SAMN05216272_107297 [Pseudomonas panipatensis]SMP50832.1 hypothetical protein SAMN06295951_102530 [Pseudomonas panipatensis]
MQISANAFSAGLQGVRSGQQQVERAAEKIAGQPAATNGEDLAKPLVDLQQGKYAALASSRTLQVADETLGTLIDISV